MNKQGTNSKDTRVQPIFGWLRAHGPDDWAQHLIKLAVGLTHRPHCGPVCRVALNPEESVNPTPARLAWMLRNISRLVPVEGRRWREPYSRTSDSEEVGRGLSTLDAGSAEGVPQHLKFETASHADCLVECEKTIIWFEGKRFDWLSPSTTWDVTRDQLARNLEAVWSLAAPKGKDYCLVICHEHPLKHHEQLLVEGYRFGTWTGGWPHIPEALRSEFGQRIGTVTWQRIANEWAALRDLPELADLGMPLS